MSDEFKVGDIVAAKTAQGDIDVDSLGHVVRNYGTSITVWYLNGGTSYYRNTEGYYDPKDLVKLDVYQLYKIIQLSPLWNKSIYLSEKKRGV